MANVFFDITIDGKPTGRIAFKLFDDIVPKATRNFPSGIYPRCLILRGINNVPQPLASGSFGEIWKGYYDQHPLRLKVARVYASSDIQRLTATFAKEAIVWSQLYHPNVLPFYGNILLGGIYRARLPRFTMDGRRTSSEPTSSAAGMTSVPLYSSRALYIELLFVTELEKEYLQWRICGPKTASVPLSSDLTSTICITEHPPARCPIEHGQETTLSAQATLVSKRYVAFPDIYPSFTSPLHSPRFLRCTHPHVKTHVE
ncbi:hypothetical protein D9756_009173 [Leucocoprinus leucothites]|uniref:PPIase cyclophilin-type domain-containing protein n=1 Tax=Leucocoprinus leucothites TaxID=201217 RepID=A0A8H5CXY1_9AGAR|nr:hypothetical protein D9756_009173 [Leucoagaricus leucothites]